MTELDDVNEAYLFLHPNLPDPKNLLNPLGSDVRSERDSTWTGRVSISTAGGCLVVRTHLGTVGIAVTIAHLLGGGIGVVV